MNVTGNSVPMAVVTGAAQRLGKAIAFELEENVERFLREFILEENPLDVRDVRAALRAYDDTRKRLEKQEDEAAFLRRFGSVCGTWTRGRSAARPTA